MAEKRSKVPNHQKPVSSGGPAIIGTEIDKAVLDNHLLVNIATLWVKVAEARKHKEMH